ncbi:hotdog fold domain-containing protein [uncultured Abyssibacter sp.]|uniref:hotdog fold domain-containing protein n=1 Tax=uncultured Abyssibacter sp. TaxID=2320202 RepID=UPI0032B222CD
MSATPPTLALWNRLQQKPAGSWLFTLGVCRKAPYFSSIKPRVSELDTGRCVVRSRLRRAVTNHIGTFHAIAMCNMAELAGGLAAEATVPTTHRWIPKGMTVEYLAKAETDLSATCQLVIPDQWEDRFSLLTPVEVTDTRGTVVFRAEITMYVSRKPARDR